MGDAPRAPARQRRIGQRVDAQADEGLGGEVECEGVGVVVGRRPPGEERSVGQRCQRCAGSAGHRDDSARVPVGGGARLGRLRGRDPGIDPGIEAGRELLLLDPPAGSDGSVELRLPGGDGQCMALGGNRDLGV